MADDSSVAGMTPSTAMGSNTSDPLGLRKALEQMLGRNLSPDASSNLTPAQVAPTTDQSGVPFYLSQDRVPADLLSQQSMDDASPSDGFLGHPEMGQSPIVKKSMEQTGDQDLPMAPQLDFGQEASKNSIDKALADRDKSKKDARFQRGMEQLTAGIAKLPVDNKQSDEMAKESGQPIQDYLLRRQEEANDPDSGLSKGMRSYMQQIGMPVNDMATAGQLKQIMPFVFKDMEAKQAQKTHSQDIDARLAEQREIANMHSQDLAMRKQELDNNKDLIRQDKMDKQDTDRIGKLNEKMTADVQSGRTAFGQAARNYQAVQNAQGLLNGETDVNNLDNRQVFELTRVLDRVLSQGNPSQFGSEHLNPDTARGYLAKLMEYATNKRQGAGAGDFVKTIRDTLNREGHMAQAQMGRTQRELLSGNKDLYTRHPEKMGDVLEGHGLPRNLFDIGGHIHQDDPASGAPAGPGGALSMDQWKAQQGK